MLNIQLFDQEGTFIDEAQLSFDGTHQAFNLDEVFPDPLPNFEGIAQLFLDSDENLGFDFIAIDVNTDNCSTTIIFDHRDYDSCPLKWVFV